MRSEATMEPAMKEWSWGDDPAVAVALVERGGILGIPTESSYGLAVDPCHQAAVESVYGVKGRGESKPLPVAISHVEQLSELGVRIDRRVISVLERIWPAPLTTVLPLVAPLPVSAGQASVAVRIPSHPRLRELLTVTGPLTATSANRAGEPPIKEAKALRAFLRGRDALVIDDGLLPGGPPSTLISLLDQRVEILRHGSFAAEAVEASLDEVLFSAETVEISEEDPPFNST